MLRKVALFCLLLVLCLVLCLCAAADEADASFSFNGARWGMTKEEVRSLSDAKPFQEPVAKSGHSALVYQMKTDGFPCIIQYNFLPNDELYNITVMAPDADKTFYGKLVDSYTLQYGDPQTKEDASLEADDAVAVMMAALIQSTGGDDFLGWQADKETVIIISIEPTYKVCYVEIRRYTDYFRFETDLE